MDNYPALRLVAPGMCYW